MNEVLLPGRQRGSNWSVLGASGSPFRSATWCAALAVVLDRCAGDLGRVVRLGPARFEGAVRRELPRWGATRPCLRIVRAVFTALGDPAGVMAHRPGALERAHLALDDWRDTRVRLVGAEARVVAVLNDLGLTGLVTTIAGLTPAGAAAILAETGDPARFASPRSLVKHAGLFTASRFSRCPAPDSDSAELARVAPAAGGCAVLSAGLAPLRRRRGRRPEDLDPEAVAGG